MNTAAYSFPYAKSIKRATIILGGLASIENPHFGIAVAAGTYVIGNQGWEVLNSIKSLPRIDRNWIALRAITMDKFEADIKSSLVMSPTLLFRKEKENRRLMAPYHARRRKPATFDIARLNWPTGWGSRDHAAEAVLAEGREEIGTLRISCAAIYVAACACFKQMQRRGIDIDLDVRKSSGREQALGLVENDQFHYVVVADAPMLLTKSSTLDDYVRLFEISRSTQAIFRKSGRRGKSGKPAIYIYPASSVEYQIRLSADGLLQSPLPQAFKEEIILDLADYFKVVDELMKPGDLILAWEPLASAMRMLSSLTELKGEKFEVSVSLYSQAEYLNEHPEHAKAFVKEFIANWGVMCRHSKLSWWALLADDDFRRSLSRGLGRRPG